MNSIETFRKKLRDGVVCIGAGITFADALVTDALGDSVDFFWIDTEHTAMNPETLARHLLAARAHNVPGFVRVGAGVTHLIKTALDAGADGIIVPQVRSVEKVRAAVADCRYPPVGRRGYGPRVPSQYGREGGKEYVGRANEHVFVAVQIETREALEQLDAIVAVPGLDSLVVGPSDLAHSLGLSGELEHPRNVEAVEAIIAKSRAAGLFVGTGMGPDTAYAAAMAKRGCQWIQVGCDFDYLVKSIGTITAELRRI